MPVVSAPVITLSTTEALPTVDQTVPATVITSDMADVAASLAAKHTGLSGLITQCTNQIMYAITSASTFDPPLGHRLIWAAYDSAENLTVFAYVKV